MKRRWTILIGVMALSAVLIGLAAGAPLIHFADTRADTFVSAARSMSGVEKTAFAREMDLRPVDPGARTGLTPDDIDRLLGEAANAAGEARTAAFAQLEEYGIYEYEGTVDWSDVPEAQSGQVTMSVPVITYDAVEGTWTVTLGGYWNTGADAFIGLGRDVGSADTFSVRYSRTGPYRSSVVRAYGAMDNGLSGEHAARTVTRSRSDGDGSVGFTFQIQDQRATVRWLPYQTAYLGAVWSGSCTYDNEFAGFDGVITGYYTHTE